MTAVGHATVPRAAPANGRLVAAAAFAMPPVILVAVALGLAFRGGGVAAEQWQPVAIGIAASIFVVAAVGAVPRLQAAALPMLVALGALVIWAAVSLMWTASREATFEQVLRLSMLAAAAFVGMAFAARAREALSLAAGLAVFGAVAAGAIEVKLLMAHTDLFSGSRLSWPINYANADAALVWLPLPALVTFAAAQPLRPLVRALFGLFATLALAVGITTQSRGGAIAVAGALGASVLIARDRGRFALTLMAIAAPAAVIAPRMVRGDAAASADVVRDRGQAALLAALAAAVLVGALGMLDRRRRFPFAGAEARVALVASVLALAVAAGLFVTTQGRPDTWLSARWDEFSNPGAASTGAPSDATHFGSGVSNRYDYWRVAWNAFQKDPVEGVGAGAFGVPWFQSRSIDESVTDAHSWQAGALAETGAVGLALLAAALLLPLARVRRARRAPGAWPIAATALGGASVYFVLHASADWFFQIPALAIPGFVVLGALASGGGESAEPVFAHLRQRGGLVIASAVVLVAAIPAYLATSAAARAGTDAATSSKDALSELDSATRLNPFSTEPLLLRSIILQLEGNRRAAVDAARQATNRAPQNWTAWVVRAHAAQAAKRPEEARAARLRAKALNPRARIGFG